MNIIPADSHALCVSLLHSISYTVLFLNPFCFNLPLTVDELSNVVKSFSADKAPGHDNQAMKIIHHQSLQNIVQPLVSIINLSLSTGLFPKSLKMAKEFVVFKTDDPTLFRNYRPISILPPLANVKSLTYIA